MGEQGETRHAAGTRGHREGTWACNLTPGREGGTRKHAGRHLRQPTGTPQEGDRARSRRAHTRARGRARACDRDPAGGRPGTVWGASAETNKPRSRRTPRHDASRVGVPPKFWPRSGPPQFGYPKQRRLDFGGHVRGDRRRCRCTSEGPCTPRPHPQPQLTPCSRCTSLIPLIPALSTRLQRALAHRAALACSTALHTRVTHVTPRPMTHGNSRERLKPCLHTHRHSRPHFLQVRFARPAALTALCAPWRRFRADEVLLRRRMLRQHHGRRPRRDRSSAAGSWAQVRARSLCAHSAARLCLWARAVTDCGADVRSLWQAR